MRSRIVLLFFFSWALGIPAIAQRPAPSSAPAAAPSPHAITCRVMEVFPADRFGVLTVIFHQKDKTEGLRLGEILKTYSGREMDFETMDGKEHRAMVYRVRSCFGRGLLILGSAEAKLNAKDDFILRIPDGI